MLSLKKIAPSLLLVSVVLCCGHEASRQEQSPAPHTPASERHAAGIVVASPAPTAPPRDAQRPDRVLRIGHTAEVTALAFSPDGQWVASGGEYGAVIIWDPQSGQERRWFGKHKKAITALAFSPDGRRLASASADRTIDVWDPSGGGLIYVLNLHHWVNSVAFSPDGRFLAASSEGPEEYGPATIEIYDAATGRKLRTIVTQWNAAVPLVITPEDRLVSSGGIGEDSLEGSVKMWDSKSGRLLKRLPVIASAISADGRWMASREYKNQQRKIIVWDLARGRRLRSLAHSSFASGPLTFSPDGAKLAAVSSDGSKIRVWETITGKILATIPGASEIEAVAFSADGKLLAAGGYPNWSAKIWNLSTAREVRAFPAQTSVTATAFDPNGGLLAASATGLRLWDIAAGRQMAFIPSQSEAAQEFPATTLAVSPNGRWVAANPDGALSVWETKSWKLLNLKSGGSWRLNYLAFGARRAVAAGAGSGTVRSWQVGQGREARTLWASTDAMAVSPGGKVLATAYAGAGEVDIWDIASGKKLRTVPGHKLSVNYLAFSPDGHWLLIGGQDARMAASDISAGRMTAKGSIKVWDTRLWKPRRSFPWGFGPAFSPDSRLIAFALPGVIQVWNLNKGVLIRTLGDTGWEFGNLVFSPDGHWLAQGRQRGVALWKITLEAERRLKR